MPYLNNVLDKGGLGGAGKPRGLWVILAKSEILQYFVKGEIKGKHFFDSHDPFVATFRLPSDTISIQKWVPPKPWDA